ncbi:hypothetical protein FN846DRAFT_903753 [Sphaerosporella brunnea]|uniref:Uncharacterized protein n=1 Tax=Sphaerosporella brunnea TaxID=1250544 RepID=A0A5J5F6I5_9PEZI|nr:hypothetical protein FN846DRAFT_903753 [Sphaerosporella brunnea]
MAHLLDAAFHPRTKTHAWTTRLAYLQERTPLKICTQPVTSTDGDQARTISKAVKECRASQGTVFLFVVNLGPAARLPNITTIDEGIDLHTATG